MIASSLRSPLLIRLVANIVTFGADWLAIKTHTVSQSVSQSPSYRKKVGGKEGGKERKRETSKGAKIEQTKRVHTNRTCKGHQSGWQTERLSQPASQFVSRKSRAIGLSLPTATKKRTCPCVGLGCFMKNFNSERRMERRGKLGVNGKQKQRSEKL